MAQKHQELCLKQQQVKFKTKKNTSIPQKILEHTKQNAKQAELARWFCEQPKKHWRCNPTPPAPATRLIEILPLIIVKNSLQTGEWYVLASTTPGQPPPTLPGWIYPIRLLETPRRSVATSKLMESKTSNERPPNRVLERLRVVAAVVGCIRGLGEYVVSKKGWNLNYIGGRYVDFPVFLLGGVRVFEGRKGGVLRCLKTVGGKPFNSFWSICAAA